MEKSKKLQLSFNILFVVGLAIAYVGAWKAGATANEASHRLDILRPFMRMDGVENRVDTLVELQKKQLAMVRQLLRGGMPSNEELRAMEEKLDSITKPEEGW